MLEGLAFAHARGIVHRDVKPSNVLVAEDDHVSVRLFDFGLAQLADADTLTAVGDVPGTLAYISPERLHGEQAGPPADVWAVGVLLWEALAGHHPFWRASPLETGEEIKTGAPSIREARPDLPDRLVAAVDAALEVEPGARPSAAGLARELRDAWWERSPRRARGRPSLRLDPRRVVAGSAGPALAAVSAGWVAAALPFYPAFWPVLARGARRRADGCALAARARLHAGRPGVPARQRLVRARRGVCGVRGRLARPDVARLAARASLLIRAGSRADRVARPDAARRLAGARDRAPGRACLCGGAAGRSRCGHPRLGCPVHRRPAEPLGIRGSEHPIAVVQAIWHWLEATPALGLEALILGLAAGSLVLVARGADLMIASVRGLLPGRDAARRAGGGRVPARGDRMDHVSRADADVPSTAGARRQKTHSWRRSTTDTYAFHR